MPPRTVRTEVEIASDWRALGAEVELDTEGHIISLDAAYRPVTNRDLESLPLLGSIKHLNLRGCSVDDESTRFIAPAATLQFVGLSQTRITDGGLEPLLSLPHLRYLSLADTYLTDASVATLSRFSNLLGLNLQGTALTIPALDELRAALPGCEIVSDDAAVDVSFLEDRDAQEGLMAFHSDREAARPRVSAAASGSPLGGTPPVVHGPQLTQPPVAEPAEQRLRRQLQSRLLDPELLETAGDLHAERGEYDAAAEAYTAALRLTGDDAPLTAKLGAALAQAGHTDAARAHLTGAFGAAEAEYQLGQVYLQQGRFDASRVAIETALAMDPSHAGARSLLTSLEQADQSRAQPSDAVSSDTLQMLLQALASGESQSATNNWGIEIRPAAASPRTAQSAPGGQNPPHNNRKRSEPTARQASYDFVD